MNLHVFTDAQGFFTNKTVDVYDSIDPNHNVYLNLSINCQNKKENITYGSIKQFLKTTSLCSLERLFMHGYSYTSSRSITLIRNKFLESKIKFFWIFWSNEYYQHPVFFSNLYKGFSRKFYFRKVLSFHLEHFKKFYNGEVSSPVYLGFKPFKRSFTEFYRMCSLMEDDYNFAMKGIDTVQYSFISYVSLKDFPEIKPDFSINKSEIMVGHSGAPILNHFEVIKKLEQLKVQNPLYVPLAYGNPAYIKALKAKINSSIVSLSIDCQETFLGKEKYYNRINNIGYFILNSHCQQALGNIFFFLWVGTKVFLNKETSSYKTMKRKSFFIYNVDDHLNMDGLKPLTAQQKDHIRKLVFDYINDERVNESWLKVLQSS